MTFPGEIFRSSSEAPLDSFVSSLKETMKHQIPTEVRWHQAKDPAVFVPPKLRECSHVFVRSDRVQPGLKSKYSGPFKVISRTDKVFLLDTDGKEDSFTIDRLKPANLKRETETV
ncbi:Hypothetical predicted protein [Paramuricea clavata]|uniref:Uncharacterized protein n=1 Tax=Paramuricea clavata TaxID=317549 RepID=A0A7D9KMY5_PARCT|nr:Hypothetical predicted protein [Paramuricea clavata]